MSPAGRIRRSFLLALAAAISSAESHRRPATINATGDTSRFFSDDGLEFTDRNRSAAFYPVVITLSNVYVHDKQVVLSINAGQEPRLAIRTFCRGIRLDHGVGCSDVDEDAILAQVLLAAPQLAEEHRLAPIATRLNVSDSPLSARLGV